MGADDRALPPAWTPLAIPTWILCLVLLTDQLVPSLPAYARLARSMALGMVIAAGVCVGVLAICWQRHLRKIGRSALDANANGLMLIATVLVTVVLHGVVADQIEGVDLARFVAALIPLCLLLAGGLALGVSIRHASERSVFRAVRLSFLMLCAIIVLKVSGLQPGSADYLKSTFPFTETSHFVLALGPIYLYMCATARAGRRDLWLLIGIALTLILKSGTFLAVLFVAALICRRFLVVLAAVGVVAVIGLTVELKYFTSRVELSNHSSNLSALVYLEGWEMLEHSLVRSRGWGVGFEQLGLHGSNVSAAEAIRDMTNGQNLNLKDGSFVLSKLGSEFGAAGLLLVGAYALFSLKCLRALRTRQGSLNEQFARSVVLGYSVDMFVRGTGYFSQSTLLFVGACVALAPAGGLLAVVRRERRNNLLVLR